MSVVLKIKSTEVALGANITVSNTTTTIGFGTMVRINNSNTTTAFVAELRSANSANLNQTTLYANLTIEPMSSVIVRKTSTDFVTGNASLRAVSVSLG